MAVDLQFYTEDVMELDVIDAGESRINYGTITPIVIKNEGTDRARACILSACPLNTLEELKTEMSEEEAVLEHEKQKNAASWKTFCLKKDGNYTPELEIGNINAGYFLQGEQTIAEPFSNKETSLFQDVWSYCLESWGNNGIKIYKDQAKSQTAQRKSIDIGERKNVEIKFKLDYEYDSSAFNKSSCLVIFPVRVDSRGYGYILSFQFRASDGKMFFGVYKDGKGMVDNLNRTYGTRIFDTNGYKVFDPNKFMGARVYTNEDDETCFEFILDGEKQTLYKTKDKTVKSTTVVDTENNYPNAGLMYFDVGMYYGDLGVTLKNFSITTETDKQVVYIKSKIDETAIDGEVYDSAISVSYIEG